MVSGAALVGGSEVLVSVVLLTALESADHRQRFRTVSASQSVRTVIEIATNCVIGTINSTKCWCLIQPLFEAASSDVESLGWHPGGHVALQGIGIIEAEVVSTGINRLVISFGERSAPEITVGNRWDGPTAGVTV